MPHSHPGSRVAPRDGRPLAPEPGRVGPATARQPHRLPLRDPDRPAHGGLGRHDRQRRPAAHRGRPPLLRERPLLGAQRLPPHLRRVPAARGPSGGPHRAPPDLPGRHRDLLGQLAPRWVRRHRLHAPGGPGGPGSRGRPGRSFRAGPADHRLLRRPPTRAGHRPLHDGVGRRRRHRPRGGWDPDRGRVVALGDVRQRADRPGGLVHRPRRAARDRESSRPLRSGRRAHVHARHGERRARPRRGGCRRVDEPRDRGRTGTGLALLAALRPHRDAAEEPILPLRLFANATRTTANVSRG